MKKAARATNVKPKTIKTDGLAGYTEGIQRVFPGVKHIVSQGIYEEVNNNLSREPTGTVSPAHQDHAGAGDPRERVKSTSTVGSLDFNLFKDHEAHRGGTPGEAANVNPPYKEWADVVRQESVGQDQHCPLSRSR